jgi:Uma2 family endonuclease
MVIAAPPGLTEEEFLSSEYDGYELIDGVPVEVPMSRESARLGGEVYFQIRTFLQAAPLGVVYPQDTAFKAWPHRPRHFRKPDAMFFAAGRLPGPGAPDGVIDIAPDLAVEVVSPYDRVVDLEAKIRGYLDAGVRLIWVIYPELASARVFRADGSVQDLGASAVLSGEGVLPGFELPLTALFPGARPVAHTVLPETD